MACGFIAKISGDALVIFLPDCLKIPAIQTARENMKTQKQRIFSILAILTMAVILTCIFAACDKVGKKQVPVYKGMTISRSFARASAMTASDVENPDLQDEQGRVEGDYDKRDDDFDQNKPFEDPNAPSIENKANSTLDVVGAAESIYYADINQDIFITIRLSNPDSYEILSFTLNGKKYSNYMFEDGSDMENLVLKVNVGNVGGIHDYTIDAIKYVDGTDIKDVRMDGDRTVKAGVRASDQTYVKVTNEQKTMTSISFDAQVVDLYSLIEKSGGYAKAVLYDGVNMTSKDITVGEKTSVVFDNLTPNTVYQYGVVALYDNLSGNGAKLNTLYKKAVYTDTIVLFKDIEVGQETLSWGYVWNDAVENKAITSLELMQNDEKLQDVDVTATRLDGLKSNNKYTLKATYKNLQNQDETISIEFATCAKATPTVEITNVVPTQTSVDFAINVTDTDSVGAIAKIELLHGEDEPIVESDLNSRSFEDLLSNNDYTIKVTYTYDLNDGVGEQQIVKTADIKTLEKATPSVEIADVQSTQTEITFELNVTDTDSVGAIAKIELLHGEDEPIVVENIDRTFANLLSNNDYTIKVTYSYDLNDGVGEQQIVTTADFKTLAKATPTVEIANVQSTQTEITFELNVTDTDSVGAIAKIELLHGEDEPIVVENIDRTFANLLSNNDYTIKVTYSYDLNDGVGEQQIVKTADIKTRAKAVPTVEIGNWTNTQHKLSADVTYTDVDVVGHIESVVLFKGETQVATTNERTHVVFDALEGDTEYTLVVTYKYNLNDGKGEQTATQIAKRYTAPQFEFVEATCANTGAVSKGDVIYFEAKVVNPSGVAIERIKINDKYYTPSSGTTKTSIIVNITVEDQFEGGNTALEVTEIEGTLRGQKVTIVPSESNVANVFVIGELDVKSIKIVDEDGKECDMVVQNKQYYYIVSFGNKTGYSIDEINISEHKYTLANGDYTMQDTQTAKIPVMFMYGMRYAVVSNVKYSNSSLGEKSKENVGVAMHAVCVRNEVPIVVTTAEQLKSMNDWGYYVLGNDINLAGTEWKDPSGFSGYFDGQGYAIKNMNFVGTVENKDFKWGLFKEATGVIKNLSLSGRLIVTMNSTGEKTYYAYAGGLCATTSGAALDTLTIENMVNDVSLYVTNNSGTAYVGGYIGSVGSAFTIVNSYNTGSVSATSTATSSSSGGYAYAHAYAYAGGLVGDGTGTITDSYNTGSVSATSTATSSSGGGYAYAYAYAGGLVGNGAVTIVNSYNTGSVSASATGNSNSTAYAGGLVGRGNQDGTVTITGSYNTGSVSATADSTAYAGGLVGHGDTVTITDSYNTGSVSATGNSYDYAGGLVGHGDTVTITDSYNTGSVSATGNSYDYAGGLVGYGSSAVTITDSYNTGDVSATSSFRAHAGGLVGHGDTVTITDSYYTLPENSHNNYGEKKLSVAEILAIIKDKWDSTVWDFDNLDENGNPTLKI